MSDFVATDTDSEIVISFVRRDGSIFNLTNKTVQIAWRIGAGTSQFDTMTILSPATDGRARYRFDSVADLPNPGQMYVEALITDTITSKNVSTAEIAQFTVRSRV